MLQIIGFQPFTQVWTRYCPYSKVRLYSPQTHKHTCTPTRRHTYTLPRAQTLTHPFTQGPSLYVQTHTHIHVPTNAKISIVLPSHYRHVHTHIRRQKDATDEHRRVPKHRDTYNRFLPYLTVRTHPRTHMHYITHRHTHTHEQSHTQFLHTRTYSLLQKIVHSASYEEHF